MLTINKLNFNNHSNLVNILLVIILGKINLSNTEKQNVLFICVDDLRHLAETDVLLPNLMKIAAKSINFKNAFAQQALCAPSRNSILTGRRPDSLRLYDFYSYWRQTVGNFTTFPQFFKENGYETFSIGKIFHPGSSSNFSDDYPYSWSFEPYHPSTEIYKDAPVCEDPFTNKLQSDLICPVSLKEQPGQTLPDLQSLEYAINVVKRRSNKPFLLAVGFHKPHLPLKFPRRYLDKVPLNEVNLPRFPYMPDDLPLVAWHPWTDVRKRDDIKRLNISFPFGEMPQRWTLKIRRSYYAAALYVDDLIGQLMSYVNLNNTIVILTSDHGWSLGENGLWAKYSNFDVALKVPLLFLVPGYQGRSVSTPVELVDIFPTLLDLTGLSKNIPNCNHNDNSTLCYDGESLKPLMKSDTTHRRDNKYAISQYPRPSVYPKSDTDKPRLKDITIMGYSLRTNRYRYTEWISFNNTQFTKNWKLLYGLELYDHQKDPDEANNLYLAPKYKNTVKKLSMILRSKVGV
ncbi:unnamed protein product [Diatraea saccharalis]|uniref:Sulfatase N-terminal domain-containing protein n=1 Tax=Diatraea saccharalis TaxID=40085 RepID=A0A9N9WEM8_9NEOP|nr:unnamed protein product [Diatraea saccharalis]